MSKLKLVTKGILHTNSIRTLLGAFFGVVFIYVIRLV